MGVGLRTDAIVEGLVERSNRRPPWLGFIPLGFNNLELVAYRELVERLRLGCNSGGNTAGQPSHDGCYATQKIGLGVMVVLIKCHAS